MHSYREHVCCNLIWYISTDFLKVSHLLRKITSAQWAVEGMAGCPSGPVWPTSWCILQSTLPFVLTSPALRTAARNTLPLHIALLAGMDPLRSQRCAHHRMDSTLVHRRKGSPTSAPHTRPPASLGPALATTGP